MLKHSREYIYRPFYLLLGLLFFTIGIAYVGLMYVMNLLVSTLEKAVKEVRNERNKYKRVK
jgi:hypothetical protein